MKFSTRSRYGLRLMIELAVRAGSNRPILLKEISASQEISEKYLSKLVIPLKNSGLIISERGAKGGYLLARRAADISVYEIVSVLEGDLAPVDCLVVPEICGRSKACSAREVVWQELEEVIADFLKSKTLDILAGIEKNCRSVEMYYI